VFKLYAIHYGLLEILMSTTYSKRKTTAPNIYLRYPVLISSIIINNYGILVDSTMLGRR
jgi:hypothetical protein